MFSKQTYINRRNQLRAQFKSGVLLFFGNDEVGMNYEDNTYHFRQDSTFLYYFGINKPGLYAVMEIESGNDYIFGDDFTIDSIVWMGSQPTIKEMAATVGVENTGSVADFSEKLYHYPRGTVQYLPPYRPEHLFKLMRFLGISPAEAKTKASVEFITAVGEQRNIKSAEEIVELGHAVSMTAEMHQAAMRYAKPGMTEAQIAAKVHEVALAAGGGISFPIIATINGQTLHNHYHGNTIKEGQLFLLDAGYETPMGYAGDMSSTFPVGKTFTEKQKEIYRITLAAHNGAIEMLKPGVHFRDVHMQVARTIFDGMKALGFTKGNIDDAVANGAHALFFPCGTGHLMGLDVHDMENLGEQYVGYCGIPKSKQFGLKSLRLGRELKPGFVLTIEPGIYFIPELIDLWEQTGTNKEYINFDRVNEYRNFGGIRNEEDILITETGHRILGKPLAKSIEDVESERAKAF
ncbi:MAG TPA: aminopeptidase P family protein [Tenuifilaceae bacterium]|nr:aminopeptidase P family protein [Tenuifilaceae bacterium]HPI44398.1 aminopeptidase P family protein [Tenuifilaceae bacterium]HPN21873.1 aminopeptidase P family protein [Tenuifilaceae bacterium]